MIGILAILSLWIVFRFMFITETRNTKLENTVISFMLSLMIWFIVSLLYIQTCESVFEFKTIEETDISITRQIIERPKYKGFAKLITIFNFNVSTNTTVYYKNTNCIVELD